MKRSNRLIWREELARVEQIPPKDYDIWTIWADRGWGKTRAALEELLRLSEICTTHTPIGPRPARTGIFTASKDHEAELMQMISMIADGDIVISGDSHRLRIDLQNGAELRFFRYSNVDSARGLNLDYFLLEQVELATPEQREATRRLFHFAHRHHPDTRMIQTCYVMPNLNIWTVGGDRRHLTIGADARENTFLKPAQVAAIQESHHD